MASNDFPLADPAPMAEAMALARSRLPRTDNLGRSGDHRDLYGAIELLTRGVVASHPQSLCAAGCSACCSLHKALFRIFRSEWDVIFDHILETWAPERIEAFTERFWAITGPYLPLLEGIQRRMEQGERVRPSREDLPIDCAFLEGGLCGVYPARAAICRGFGHFGLRPEDGGPLEIYSCNMQREALKAETGGPRIALPVFNGVYARLETLCDGDDKKLIPLWIAASFPRRVKGPGDRPA